MVWQTAEGHLEVAVQRDAALSVEFETKLAPATDGPRA